MNKKGTLQYQVYYLNKFYIIYSRCVREYEINKI